VDRFDAELFRFAPAEAAATDPAQRILMQQTLLALSDAAAVMGSEVGAFTGKANLPCSILKSFPPFLDMPSFHPHMQPGIDFLLNQHLTFSQEGLKSL